MKVARAMELFEASNGYPIRVASPSGIDYWLDRDVVAVVEREDDPLVYVYPVAPHPRRKCSYAWVRLANLVALGDEPDDDMPSG